jgi:starch phosphorylase
MRASMARLTQTFSANRAVGQYTDERYVSAAAAFWRCPANQGSLGAELVAWEADLAAKHWPSLRFGCARVEQKGEQHLFQVQVFFRDLSSEAVRVEFYAEGQNGATRKL